MAELSTPTRDKVTRVLPVLLREGESSWCAENGGYGRSYALQGRCFWLGIVKGEINGREVMQSIARRTRFDEAYATESRLS